jgi:hypothetical protein
MGYLAVGTIDCSSVSRQTQEGNQIRIEGDVNHQITAPMSHTEQPNLHMTHIRVEHTIHSLPGTSAIAGFQHSQAICSTMATQIAWHIPALGDSDPESRV